MKTRVWCLLMVWLVSAGIRAQEMDMRMVLEMLPPNTFVPPSPDPEARKAMDIQSYFLEKMFLHPLMSSSEQLNETDQDDDSFDGESKQTKGLMNGLMGKIMAGQLAKRDILRLNKTLRPSAAVAATRPVVTSTEGATPSVPDRQPYHIQLGW